MAWSVAVGDGRPWSIECGARGNVLAGGGVWEHKPRLSVSNIFVSVSKHFWGSMDRGWGHCLLFLGHGFLLRGLWGWRVLGRGDWPIGLLDFDRPCSGAVCGVFWGAYCATGSWDFWSNCVFIRSRFVGFGSFSRVGGGWDCRDGPGAGMCGWATALARAFG